MTKKILILLVLVTDVSLFGQTNAIEGTWLDIPILTTPFTLFFDRNEYVFSNNKFCINRIKDDIVIEIIEGTYKIIQDRLIMQWLRFKSINDKDWSKTSDPYYYDGRYMIEGKRLYLLDIGLEFIRIE